MCDHNPYILLWSPQLVTYYPKCYYNYTLLNSFICFIKTCSAYPGYADYATNQYDYQDYDYPRGAGGGGSGRGGVGGRGGFNLKSGPLTPSSWGTVPQQQQILRPLQRTSVGLSLPSGLRRSNSLPGQGSNSYQGYPRLDNYYSRGDIGGQQQLYPKGDTYPNGGQARGAYNDPAVGLVPLSRPSPQHHMQRGLQSPQPVTMCLLYLFYSYMYFVLPAVSLSSITEL